MARYDRDRSGYAPRWGYGATGATPGYFPGVWGWMGAPLGYGYPYGYGNWAAPYDYAGFLDYDREYRERPEESPAYGRGGDEQLRRWAESRGYDAGYTIQPHFRDRSAGRGSYGGGYDRGYRVRGYDRGYRR